MTTTKRCPECGGEYLTGVERCFDCDVALVEVVDDPDGRCWTTGWSGRASSVARAPGGSHRSPGSTIRMTSSTTPTRTMTTGTRSGSLDEDRQQVEYHLHEWSAEFRAMLEQLVSGAGVAHVWEGATMVVAAADEDRVDELVEQVEMTDELALDPLAEKTVYEVSDWSMDQLSVLPGALGEAGIPHQFDIEGDLAVLADGRGPGRELLDVLEFAPESAIDAGEGDPDDGIETAEILSDLFVACDRLQNDARDHAGVLGGVDARQPAGGPGAAVRVRPRSVEGHRGQGAWRLAPTSKTTRRRPRPRWTTPGTCGPCAANTSENSQANLLPASDVRRSGEVDRFPKPRTGLARCGAPRASTVSVTGWSSPSWRSSTPGRSRPPGGCRSAR